MTEAWMKRGSERQEFMEKLYRQIIDEEGESVRERHLFHIAFITSILYCLGEREMILFAPPFRDSLAFSLLYRFLPEIRRFARTREEETFLITELLITSTTSLTSFSRQVLSTQETFQGELVFEGHRAMDDV